MKRFRSSLGRLRQIAAKPSGRQSWAPALLGAVLGIVGTLLGTWTNNHFAAERESREAERSERREQERRFRDERRELYVETAKLLREEVVRVLRFQRLKTDYEFGNAVLDDETADKQYDDFYGPEFRKLGGESSVAGRRLWDIYAEAVIIASPEVADSIQAAINACFKDGSQPGYLKQCDNARKRYLAAARKDLLVKK